MHMRKFTKLEIFGILVVLQIFKFWKFDDFRNCTKNLGHFWNCEIWEVFGILRIGKLTHFQNFWNLENENLTPRIGKF